MVVEFQANIDTVPDMMAFVETQLLNFEKQTAFDITLVCEEILVNITSYAYPDKDDGTLGIIWEHDEKCRTLKITFQDSGIPFNPLERQIPNLNVPLDERKIGGLGIVMVRKRMTDVQYTYVDSKNSLTITKEY